MPLELEKKRHRAMVWIIRILGFIITCYVGLYIFSQSVPYNPYEVKGYNAVPDEICAGDTIRVDVTRYVDPDGNIRSITTRTSWKEAKTGASTGITEYVTDWSEVSNKRYGLSTIKSPIVRELPEKAGDYRIVSEYDIRGEVLFWSRTDSQSIISDKVLHVLDGDDKRCSGY